MEYNYGGAYPYPWNSGFVPNVYNRHPTPASVNASGPGAGPGPAQTPIQPPSIPTPTPGVTPPGPTPGFSADVLYGAQRFGGPHFAFGMNVPYPSNNPSHSAHGLNGNWNYHGYNHNNLNTLNQYETVQVSNVNTVPHPTSAQLSNVNTVPHSRSSA